MGVKDACAVSWYSNGILHESRSPKMYGNYGTGLRQICFENQQRCEGRSLCRLGARQGRCGGILSWRSHCRPSAFGKRHLTALTNEPPYVDPGSQNALVANSIYLYARSRGPRQPSAAAPSTPLPRRCPRPARPRSASGSYKSSGVAFVSSRSTRRWWLSAGEPSIRPISPSVSVGRGSSDR
jgi:hypothetical protein